MYRILILESESVLRTNWEGVVGLLEKPQITS